MENLSDYNKLQLFVVFVVIILVKSLFSLFAIFTTMPGVNLDKKTEDKILFSKMLLALVVNTITIFIIYYIVFGKNIKNIYSISILIFFTIRTLLNYTVGLDIYNKLFNIKPGSDLDKQIIYFNDKYTMAAEFVEIGMVVYVLKFLFLN
jgi:hypothetical protein